MGGGGRLRHHRGAGGARESSISVRIGASGSPRRLGSFCEAPGQPPPRPVPQFTQSPRGAGPPDSPIHQVGAVAPWEPFPKDVAFHEILFVVTASVVTSRIPVEGVRKRFSFLFTLVFLLPC